MKIVVLNGSPKGMNSVTMQYILFLKKKLPQHDFVILNVCQEIKKLEDDPKVFQEVLDAVSASDGIIWAFPLYYMLIHANYKRFIELVFADDSEAFKGKYAATLTTSIHFYDHTANDYVNGICDDLGMKFVGSYSAAMDDLLEPKEQERLLSFGNGFFHTIENGYVTPKRFQPIVHSPLAYAASSPVQTIDTEDKKVLILHDADDPDCNLSKMVARMQECFGGKATVINLHELNIKGACLGCCQCGLDNVCVYKDTDDVHGVYQKLIAADVVVMAGSIHDRYWSARWKKFIDRGFFMNHVPILTGKQIGYLVAGPLGQLATLQQIFEAYVSCQGANLVGMVTDECGDSQELDHLLNDFAARLIDGAKAGYLPPPNFLSVGGQKLFRDAIWAELRLVFRKDHQYYKTHGLYDFPKRSLKTKLFHTTITLLLLLPGFRKEFRKRIRDEMVKPLQKVVEES